MSRGKEPEGGSPSRVPREPRRPISGAGEPDLGRDFNELETILSGPDHPPATPSPLPAGLPPVADRGECDLDRIVRERGPMTIAQAVDCVIQAARGMEAAHGRGFVHGAITPATLMLDAGGTLRILDPAPARVLEAAG